MTTVHNICKHAYFIESDTENILSEAWLEDVIETNPFSECEPDRTPFLLIGENIFIEGDNKKDCIDSLYLSPSGQIVIAEANPFRSEISCDAVLQQIDRYIEKLKSWNYEKLNSIVYDFTYKKRGQAFNIIDLFAEKGYATFSDEENLIKTINDNLENADFLIFLVGDEIKLTKK